jgi:hypothetical protein
VKEKNTLSLDCDVQNAMLNPAGYSEFPDLPTQVIDVGRIQPCTEFFKETELAINPVHLRIW